ncbi:MAG: hypothetical protein K0S34_1187 [Bacillales bacterium]|jgi:putative ATPase|nr:hypothetical protein [Bacillales bacterium]
MAKKPLAFRMRPKNICDIIGQEHLLGHGKQLNRMVTSNYLSSMILYGPPGVGKTSIATAIAGTLEMPHRVLNAVINNKKDIEIVVEEAKMCGGNLILIMDEVHRLNKDKQDLLLPYLENGLLILIGCTTSNPFHSINPAIRSRCHIFELLALNPEQITIALKRALNDKNNGLGNYNVVISESAMLHLASVSGGDIRSALNGLELAVLSTVPDEDQKINISLEIVKECIQKKNFSHDKEESHYNVLSAFQKSIRGSDVNASLHYLARLIEAGDLQSIARRMTVIAYEDIGLANPALGPRTLAAIDAAERVGFPEARIPLASIVVELALSPKSNSAYSALDAAIADLHSKTYGDIPLYLKAANYKGADSLGRGIGYKYPHDFESGWTPQVYLPSGLAGTRYYHPKQTSKHEQTLASIYNKINEIMDNK